MAALTTLTITDVSCKMRNYWTLEEALHSTKIHTVYSYVKNDFLKNYKGLSIRQSQECVEVKGKEMMI